MDGEFKQKNTKPSKRLMKGIEAASAPCSFFLTSFSQFCERSACCLVREGLSRAPHSLCRVSLQGTLPIPVPSSSALPERR